MNAHARTIAAFDQLAEAYQARFMNVRLYDDTYDRLCQLLAPDAQVLELGCGPGNLTRALLQRRPDLRILATDPAPNMLRLAAANNPGIRCQQLAAHEIGQLPEHFDAVVAGFCLPYLSPAETAQLAHDAYALLVPGGFFYLSFIDDVASRSGVEASSNGQAQAYVYYHPAADVQDTLTMANFVVNASFRKPYSRSAALTDTHVIFIAQKPAV